jgi:hypothetical protein
MCSVTVTVGEFSRFCGKLIVILGGQCLRWLKWTISRLCLEVVFCSSTLCQKYFSEHDMGLFRVMHFPRTISRWNW